MIPDALGRDFAPDYLKRSVDCSGALFLIEPPASPHAWQNTVPDSGANECCKPGDEILLQICRDAPTGKADTIYDSGYDSGLCDRTGPSPSGVKDQV